MVVLGKETWEGVGLMLVEVEVATDKGGDGLESKINEGEEVTDR